MVFVSWFAANAYCQSVQGRLPSTLEWEFVAAASEKKTDASRDDDYLAKILNWYSRPRPVHNVKMDPPNIYGVYDLHGLIWEWTSDFNSSFITADNREDGEQSKNLFCGNSGQNAENRANYAAFMRYAMRSSLRPNYVTEYLGFRCAYDSSHER
jgi:formylglycine-generating enzyme required for sulfatase activity